MKRNLIMEGLMYGVGTSKEIANYKGKLLDIYDDDWNMDMTHIMGLSSQYLVACLSLGHNMHPIIGAVLAGDLIYRLLSKQDTKKNISDFSQGLIGLVRETYQSVTKESKE